MYIYKQRKWKVSSFEMLRYNGVLPILYSVYDIQMYTIIYYTYNVEYLSRRYVEWWIVTGMIQHICKLMTYGSIKEKM
jgi:hypothetical protein